MVLHHNLLNIEYAVVKLHCIKSFVALTEYLIDSNQLAQQICFRYFVLSESFPYVLNHAGYILEFALGDFKKVLSLD